LDKIHDGICSDFEFFENWIGVIDKIVSNYGMFKTMSMHDCMIIRIKICHSVNLFLEFEPDDFKEICNFECGDKICFSGELQGRWNIDADFIGDLKKIDLVK
jgi:hypothetical protein